MKSNLAGCVIEFGPNLKLRLKDQIGYGSFSFVYSTNDPRYVVKMINASDPKSLVSYNNEKFAFQNIKKHENIINCPAFKDNTLYKEITYCCLALENCPRGSIITMIVDKKMIFQETQILQIFLDALLGVHQMHNVTPQPIAHRDLKGENILLGLDGRFKLTDFGSITNKKVFEITRENREAIQEDIDKSTTPTIRAPEQCDLYSGFPITEKVDVWALGCLLYILCFQKQPFETKLSTINCQYFMVDAHKYSKKLIELFPLFFVVDPRKRPNTAFILNHFEANFQSIPRTPFEAPGQQVASTKPQKGTKQTEGQYVPNFGDFGKSGVPIEFLLDKKESQGIKPTFKDAWQKKIKTITTKTQAWMLTAVEETEEGPNQRFIRYLIIKAWQKPHKIKKFYDVTHKKLLKNLENTIIILKALILLHNYTKKGPNDVYFQKSTPNVSYPKDLYRAIADKWKMIVDTNKTSTRDKARSSYISNIILEYAKLLSKKTDMLQQHFRIIEGCYSINPFLSHPGEDNSPVTEPVIKDLLNYMQSLIDFHKIILLNRNLWTIQCNLALSVLDEEFCLISLLTHLIVAFKKSSNYAPSKTNATATKENLQTLEEKYISCYQQLQKLFENARKVNGFVERSTMLPVLPNEVIKGIQSISVLNPPKEQEFYAKEHLSTSKSIYSLKIPMSYGTFIKNINLEQIIYIEEDILEAKPSAREIPVERKQEVNISPEKKQLIEDPSKVVAQNPQMVQKNPVNENQVPVRREEKVDFNADFDAFNKIQNVNNFNNFDQQGFNVIQQGNMNQTDLFAGFNFNAAMQKMGQQHNVQETMQIPEEWKSPEKPKQEIQEVPVVVPDARPEDIVDLDNVNVEHAPIQPQETKPAANIAQGPETGSPIITLDNAVAEQEFKGLVVEPADIKEVEKQEIENQAGSQQDLSQQDMLSSSRSGAGSRRPLGYVQNRRTGTQPKGVSEEEMSQKAENIKVMSNRPNVRAALLAKEQARRQQKDVTNPGQLNANPFNTDSVDTTLSLAKENMQNAYSNYQTAPQQFVAAAQKNLEEIPDLIELPPDVENLPEQIKEESVSRSLAMGSQKGSSVPEDTGYRRLAMGSKKESSAPSQLAGDVESEIYNSPGSKGYTSPDKSMQNYSAQDQINMLNNPGQGVSVAYGKLSDDEKEEETKVENLQAKQGTPEFTFEALYASAGKDKPSALNNEKGSAGHMPYNEWDNVFDVQNNADIQKISNLQQQQNQAVPPEYFSFSGQEVTSHHLQKFIHQEVSRNIADWIIDYSQLKFKEQIGSGGSAQVYRGLWRGTEVAIKKMSLDQLPDDRKKEFKREIAALMKLRPHKNLVNFMGVSLNGNELCIISEYCSGGTLFEWLHMKKYFPVNWQQKIKMASDVACGMNYLHTCSPPIIHRDLKSLNLLLDGPLESESQRFSVKLADFGLAKTEDQAQEMKTGIMGTFHWMAPEIFDNKVYTVKADVYSFGIVLYEIVTRETPYQELKTPIEIMRYVSVEKQRPNLSKVPVDCPRQLVDLMIRCWAHEPQDRPDFGEILDKIKFLSL